MSGDPEKKVKDKSQNEKKIYLPTKLFTKNSSLKDKNSSRMSVSKTQTTERKMSQGWNACFLPQSIQVPIRHLKECSQTRKTILMITNIYILLTYSRHK